MWENGFPMGDLGQKLISNPEYCLVYIEWPWLSIKQEFYI